MLLSMRNIFTWLFWKVVATIYNPIDTYYVSTPSRVQTLTWNRKKSEMALVRKGNESLPLAVSAQVTRLRQLRVTLSLCRGQDIPSPGP